ncbi:MAG: HAMP domain-containing histidine kinase [Propionibacteriaceae bacterium]|nr:HAMP domain-containing histidine kinase [Propionibacteriaceae bacterium]
MGLVGWFVARRAVRPLADALTLQRHFVADASHELRTPLTVLSTRIQLLQRKLARGEPVEPTVTKLKDDATSMNEVLNDLLLTVEGATPDATPTPVRAAVNEAVESLRPIADQAHVHLAATATADPAVLVAPKSLSRAVVALVDNAIQHSPTGAAVEVTTSVEGATAVIRVRDHGPGIPDADPTRMFERFAHGAETGRKRSFGLGLALVSEIAQRNHGDIAIEATGPEGTTFALRLPLAA